MFGLLRGAAVIGVIFLLSPVRTEPAPRAAAPQRAEEAVPLPSALARSLVGLDLAEMERTWKGLPEGTRQRLLKLLAEEVAGSAETGSAATGPPAPGPRRPSGDTLRPEDRQPPWRGVRVEP